MADAERQAWDRQPGESSWDFARFCRYRDLGAGRSLPDAVLAWLVEKPSKRVQQRRFQVAEDPEAYAKSVGRRWNAVCGKWHWVERVRLWDEMIEAEARQRAIVEHVEEEAEQLRLRIVAARTLRARGLAVWDRFGVLVDEGKLEEMMLEEIKHVVMRKGRAATATEEEKPESRAERRVLSIFSQLGLAKDAIAEGLKQERLELGEPTERSAVDLTEQRNEIDRELEAMSREGRSSLRDELERLIGDGETAED